MNVRDEDPPVTAVTLVDVTLRDGSHSVSHQFTLEQVSAAAGRVLAAANRTIGWFEPGA